MTSDINVPSDADRLNRALGAIRAKFLTSRPDRLVALSQAAAEMDAETGNCESLMLIRRECHKIAGLSGSIGYHALGELAGDIDIKIKDGRAGWDEIRPMLHNLISYLENLEA